MIMETILATALLLGPTPTDGGPDVSRSTYTGKHYAPRWEAWRKCVVWRESRDNPKARNRTSSASGTYQFLDRAWRKSLTWMLLPEHKNQRRDVIALRAIPINAWPRYWQDAAFWTVLDHGKGAKHWAAQRSACNAVRP
jgi:muramidase (phage lysozyme)